jgi:hypothetical protein
MTNTKYFKENEMWFQLYECNTCYIKFESAFLPPDTTKQDLIELIKARPAKEI